MLWGLSYWLFIWQQSTCDVVSASLFLCSPLSVAVHLLESSCSGFTGLTRPLSQHPAVFVVFLSAKGRPVCNSYGGLCCCGVRHGEGTALICLSFHLFKHAHINWTVLAVCYIARSRKTANSTLIYSWWAGRGWFRSMGTPKDFLSGRGDPYCFAAHDIPDDDKWVDNAQSMLSMKNHLAK